MTESYSDWSRDWKALRHWDGDARIFERVLEQWRKPVPADCVGRKLITTLGMRKDTELLRGEQVIESMLLGARDFSKEHRIVNCIVNGSSLLALYNNQALARIKKGDHGQVIADAFGMLRVRSVDHPLAIEIKESRGADCWHAVVQNLQQIRILRANVKNVESSLHTHGSRAVGAWGMVLAPVGYWTRKQKLHLAEASALLEKLKSAGTQARVLLASFNKESEEIRLVGGHLSRPN